MSKNNEAALAGAASRNSRSKEGYHGRPLAFARVIEGGGRVPLLMRRLAYLENGTRSWHPLSRGKSLAIDRAIVALDVERDWLAWFYATHANE